MENGLTDQQIGAIGRLPNRIKWERIRRKATVVRSYCFSGENSASFLKIALKRVIFFGFYFEKELNGNDVLTNLTLCGGCKDLITSQRTQYDHS